MFIDRGTGPSSRVPIKTKFRGIKRFMAEKTIWDAQSEIETALRYLRVNAQELPDDLKPLLELAPPIGLRPQVSLREGKNLKESKPVQQDAPLSRWSKSCGFVAVSYWRPPIDEEEVLYPGISATEPPSPTRAGDPVRETVLLLAQAEKDPQLGFVSLKWFRDTYLTQQGFAWAALPEDRQRVLVDVIERNWVLTSKVENPKNPQFPVTAIKVNRALAEVLAILEQQRGTRPRFNPITMRGEALSQTVVRDRR